MSQRIMMGVAMILAAATGICFWHFRFRLELMRSLLLDKNDFLRGLESA